MKKKLLVWAVATSLYLFGQVRRQTFIIELPLPYADHGDVVYLKVFGKDRIDALAGSGVTVFTQAEWDDICKRIGCSQYKVADGTRTR